MGGREGKKRGWPPKEETDQIDIYNTDPPSDDYDFDSETTVTATKCFLKMKVISMP